MISRGGKNLPHVELSYEKGTIFISGLNGAELKRMYESRGIQSILIHLYDNLTLREGHLIEEVPRG